MQTQIIHDAQVNERTVPNPLHSGFDVELYDIEQEAVYANSYVDMGAVDTVGFDYDYTLVTYTETLLELIYDMAYCRFVMQAVGLLSGTCGFAKRQIYKSKEP